MKPDTTRAPRWGGAPDEHNIFKTFLRASFHLLSPDWQVQTYVQTFRHDDSNIWNSFEWSTPMWVVAMGVVAMWVGRVGEGGKAINQVSSIKFDTCWRLFTTHILCDLTSFLSHFQNHCSCSRLIFQDTVYLLLTGFSQQSPTFNFKMAAVWNQRIMGRNVKYNYKTLSFDFGMKYFVEEKSLIQFRRPSKSSK